MEILIGKVTHYYKNIGIAAIELSDTLEVGNLIHIKGHTTDFEQNVNSMEIDNKKITHAARGQVIGLKVNDYVREHDMVYRIEN
ncbi:MAG: translation elongation factor-like protein [Nitrospirae bacterium]|nr:translation elongation factor-like protein [Nitrospirota bacterium]